MHWLSEAIISGQRRLYVLLKPSCEVCIRLPKSALDVFSLSMVWHRLVSLQSCPIFCSGSGIRTPVKVALEEERGKRAQRAWQIWRPESWNVPAAPHSSTLFCLGLKIPRDSGSKRSKSTSQNSIQRLSKIEGIWSSWWGKCLYCILGALGPFVFILFL